MKSDALIFVECLKVFSKHHFLVAMAKDCCRLQGYCTFFKDFVREAK